MPAINKKKPYTLKKQLKAKAITSKVDVTAVPRKTGKASRGILFIRHIPRAFFEEQLRLYFGKFGLVTRTRIARSADILGKRSRCYAFVEYLVPEVAKIAAETMDQFVMWKEKLETAYIPPENQTINFFRPHSRRGTKETQRTPDNSALKSGQDEELAGGEDAPSAAEEVDGEADSNNISMMDTMDQSYKDSDVSSELFVPYVNGHPFKHTVNPCEGKNQVQKHKFVSRKTTNSLSTTDSSSSACSDGDGKEDDSDSENGYLYSLPSMSFRANQSSLSPSPPRLPLISKQRRNLKNGKKNRSSLRANTVAPALTITLGNQKRANKRKLSEEPRMSLALSTNRMKQLLADVPMNLVRNVPAKDIKLKTKKVLKNIKRL